MGNYHPHRLFFLFSLRFSRCRSKHVLKQNTFGILNLLLRLEKWAACSDTLVVLRIEPADNLFGFHLYAEMLLDKIYGRQNGQEGIPLAAAGAANLANLFQRFRGHPMGQREGFIGKRRRFREDGHKHSCAYARAAGAPKAASATGDAFPAFHHFKQRRMEIQIAACILVGR